MSETKPKKGGFFKKPAWLEEKAKVTEAPEETKDATQLFARSTQTMAEALAEAKRKELIREEKKKARAAQRAAEEGESHSKRRRMSEEDLCLETTRPTEKKDSISPHRNSTSLLERNQANTSTKRSKASAEVIELEEESEPEVMPTPRKRKPPRDRNPAPLPEPVIIREEPAEEFEEEDEELAALTREARERAKESQGLGRSMSTHSVDDQAAATPPVEDEPNPIMNILIYSNIEGTNPLMVKRKYRQNFRDIRIAWAQRQTSLPEHVRREIKFMWRGKRVFDAATCRSLGIKLDTFGTPVIPVDQGYMEEVADKVVLCATTDAQLALEKSRKEWDEARRKREEEAKAQPPPPPAPAGGGGLEGQLRIILKAKDFPEQKLIVKPDTTVERLVGAFAKQHKIPDTKKVLVLVDGDEMELSQTMQDADIQDMDMVEVVVR